MSTTTMEKTPTSALPNLVTEEAKAQRPALTLHLEDNLGMQLHFPVSTIEKAYELRKAMGKKGFSNPGKFPAGGYQMPYALAETFDWSLIGAVPGILKDKDGEAAGVWYKGRFYKMREAEEEIKGQKKKARIWYTRGAKFSDSAEFIEGATGDNKGYVCLISFQANGPINPNFVKK